MTHLATKVVDPSMYGVQNRVQRPASPGGGAPYVLAGRFNRRFFSKGGVVRGNLRDAAERFSSYLALERRLSPRSVTAYDRELVVGMEFLTRLSAEQRMPNQLGAEGVAVVVARAAPSGAVTSPKTQNHRLSIWREFSRFLVEREGWPASPADGVRWAKVPRDARVRPVLGLADVAALVRAAQAQPDAVFAARDAAIVGLLFHCGLRLSELTSLGGVHIKDVRAARDHGDAAPVDELRPAAPALAGVLRKGGVLHDLPLNRQAVTLLAAWLLARQGLQLAAREEALFVSRQRARISGRAVEQLVGRLGEAAQLPQRVTPHLLRHSFCTALLAGGVPFPTVQRLMNHSLVTTTALYAHPGADEARRAVETLAGGAESR